MYAYLTVLLHLIILLEMHVLAWRALTFITCSFTLVSLTLTICLSVFIRKHAYEDIDEFLYLQL